ncbi:M1 family metallopeptidase [Microbulbifer elongatus]|uniref:M1 family metallopeptidase n=1 Tax=Microbulbifer elongatus TaxID=86173 RepID=UPI001CFEF888|nr:M1 family metallopeptidase [Microbulbifer elongatus]
MKTQTRRANSWAKPFWVPALLVTALSGYQVHALTVPAPFQRLTQTDLGLGHYRTANGMPAENYWQQQVDYRITAQLDPAYHQITASAEVTYHNNSPDALQFLFFALDHNALKPDSAAAFNLRANDDERSRELAEARSDAIGFKIQSITDASGKSLDWRIRDTHLQVVLSQPLGPDARQSIEINWTLPLSDKVATGARSGFEMLKDGAPIYVAAQWFPRAVAYTDYAGWQLKPFLQQGEFSSEFGDYQVAISVPANYVVAASGALQNAREILSRDQLAHWKGSGDSPTHIVDAVQAQSHRKAAPQRLVEWKFSGNDLRDFAFSASPAFLWQVKTDKRGRRLQQFYPHEAAPLWEKFGLAAIDHTLAVFDNALFPLQSESVSIVNAAGFGMEYPGLATIATRPERHESTKEQPAWDRLTKYDFIGTVIHEVGHNYVPMRINTDEREWAWLDEGLVSFIEYRAEHSWEANFDVIYGEPRSIAGYTASDLAQPIMSSADSLHKKIDNAYNKTASMLNTLRHLVLGAEVFDPALQHFARNWQGKRPTPGDFFRAVETAAGTDLSWFWHSWFYQDHAIDLAMGEIRLDDMSLAVTPADSVEPAPLAHTAGGMREFVVDRSPHLADVYTKNGVTPELNTSQGSGRSNQGAVKKQRWYTLEIVNHEQGVLPVPLELALTDGSQHRLQVPAQAWMRAKNGTLSLQLPLSHPLARVCIDPLWLTPDTQRNNNCVEVQAP